MQCDSGDPWHVHTIDAPVFLGGDAVAALAVSLTAAENASTDRALAARASPPSNDRAHQPPVAAVLH